MKQFKLLKATDASSVVLLNTIFEGSKRIVNSDGINDYFIFNRNFIRTDIKTLFYTAHELNFQLQL